MENDKLTEIQNRLSTNDVPETNHIGLCNVNQRIKVLFGENYGCYIYSTDMGTLVKITMPIKS